MQLARKLIIGGNVIAFIAVAIAALALKGTKSTRRPPNNPSKTMLQKAIKLEATGAFNEAAMAYQASLKRLNSTERRDAQKGYWRAQAQAVLSLDSTDPEYRAKYKAHTDSFFDPQYKVVELSKLIRWQNAIYTQQTRTREAAPSIGEDWSIWLTWLTAQAAAINGAPGVALKALERFLSAFPDHNQGLALRYRLAKVLKDDDLALTTARRLASVSPSPTLTTAIAELLIRTGEHTEAREMMKAEIEKSGATTKTVLTLVQAHLQGGDGKQAALVLTRAIDLVSQPDTLRDGINLLRMRGYPELAQRVQARLAERKSTE